METIITKLRNQDEDKTVRHQDWRFHNSVIWTSIHTQLLFTREMADK